MRTTDADESVGDWTMYLLDEADFAVRCFDAVGASDAVELDSETILVVYCDWKGCG